MSNVIPWKVSLHGGHSGQFCDHAKGSLRELVEAAIESGMPIYGMSEHGPRYHEDHMFPTELERGEGVDYLIDLFHAYSKEASLLQKEYGDRINLLKGFEIESIDESYYDKMLKLKNDGKFDYIIGSLHHVRGICIDAWPEWLDKAIELCGGLENTAVEYYSEIEQMIRYVKPEVLGHIDLIGKFVEDVNVLNTTKINEQLEKTLHAAKENEIILDLNVYPYRKGKEFPYPAPWIVEMARDMGLTFCFGDDSHSPDSVGVGIEKGREYLLSHKVHSITSLSKNNGQVKKIEIGLL